MASPAKSSASRDDADAPAPAPAPQKTKRGAFLPLLAATLVAAAMASGSTWFLASHKAGKAATAKPAAADDADKGDAAQNPAPALYLELTPAFVVNLADDEAMRFLQVEVQIMSRDPKVIDAAKDHMPRIRNSLLMLFGQQHFHELGTREAKEALQKQALQEVQKALDAEGAPSQVEAVYFTSLVMQ
jgi:flagellar FliL protein